MELRVQSLNGRVNHINIQRKQSVMELKRVICENIGVPAERQRLIYGGRPLCDTAVIENCGLRDGDLIFMVLALRGG